MTVEELVGFWTRHFGGGLAPAESINIRLLPVNPEDFSANRFFSTLREGAEYALSHGKSDNVYFGVNPRKGGGGGKAGVIRIVTLHADLDVGAGKVFANKTDAYDALMKGLYPYAPDCIVDSGGGLHAYWRVESLPPTPENIALAESTMSALYRALGGTDRVQDVSRVLRVPGTLNHKNGEEVRVIYANH